ncbi:hypothetical protein GCM10010392_30850 [Streptomyces clavifer]|nr:hypothetical protein GCM10010392_30850 [Streptomyces clavifer]
MVKTNPLPVTERSGHLAQSVHRTFAEPWAPGSEEPHVRAGPWGSCGRASDYRADQAGREQAGGTATATTARL